MERIKSFSNLFVILLAAVIVTVVMNFVNVWLFSSSRILTPTDAFFLEGLLAILLGFLLLLGRGGINLVSVKAAILSAVAAFVYKKDEMGPNEIMRRDKWKPEGFVRLSLVLILSGVLMLLVYFLI